MGFILPAPPKISQALFSWGLPGQRSVSAERSSPAWQLPRPPSGSSKAMVVMEMSEKQGVQFRPELWRREGLGKRDLVFTEPLLWAWA